MDTSNSQNYVLIEEIKTEAYKSNLLEAFLDSAPQVFVQLWAAIDKEFSSGTILTEA